MAVSVRDDARPLAGTLEELTALYTYLDARAADGPPTGWITAEALAAPGLPHLSDLVAAVTVATGTTDRQIGVSFFLNGYAWLVAAAALGCYLLAERAPDLTPSSIALHFDADGRADGIAFLSRRFAALPTDPAADHPDATIVPDRAALRDHLREALEAHMAPLIPALRAQSPLGTRALWVTVADRCAGFLYWMQHLHPDLFSAEMVLAEVPALVQAPGSPLANRLTCVTAAHTPDGSPLSLRRGACCLNYRRPDGKLCESCPLNRPPAGN